MLSSTGDSALHVAVQAGRMDVVGVLVAWGTDIMIQNSKGQTVFHTAALFGEYRPLRGIMPYLDVNTVVDLKDSEGMTPVHAAVAKDSWIVLDIFIEFGKLAPSDMASVDKHGR